MSSTDPPGFDLEVDPAAIAEGPLDRSDRASGSTVRTRAFGRAGRAAETGAGAGAGAESAGWG